MTHMTDRAREVAGTMCASCGVRPATCVGPYEGPTCSHVPPCEPQLVLCSDMVDQAACDECCGHGNEDGHCHPIHERNDDDDRVPLPL